MEQNFEHINDDLLVKYLLGEASDWEQEVVRKWIAEDAANQQYFDQFQLIWNTSKQLALSSTADENKAWERFQKRVSNGSTALAPAKKIAFSWMRIAAAAVLVIGIGLITYVLINNTSEPKELLVQTLENVIKDTLSDGSMVTLNKKSSLSYPSRFKGNKRAVKLNGEAFFNVAPDKENPFIIQANGVEITVVGTSFNVKTENARTEVVVETGIVRVTKDGQTIELKAGEKTIVSAESGPPAIQEVTDKLYNYYRTKEFVCDDTPLWKLVQVINEAYNANIVFGRDDLRNLSLNTTFNNESLDQVLNVISITFDIKVVKEQDRIILK